MNTFALLRNSFACILTTLVTVGIVTGSANAQPPQALFPIATQLPSLGSPVFAGDFNGDGVTDLAYLNVGSNYRSC